jgi:hypothetical protein
MNRATTRLLIFLFGIAATLAGVSQRLDAGPTPAPALYSRDTSTDLVERLRASAMPVLSISTIDSAAIHGGTADTVRESAEIDCGVGGDTDGFDAVFAVQVTARAVGWFHIVLIPGAATTLTAATLPVTGIVLTMPYPTTAYEPIERLFLIPPEFHFCTVAIVAGNGAMDTSAIFASIKLYHAATGQTLHTTSIKRGA